MFKFSLAQVRNSLTQIKYVLWENVNSYRPPSQWHNPQARQRISRDWTRFWACQVRPGNSRQGSTWKVLVWEGPSQSLCTEDPKWQIRPLRSSKATIDWRFQRIEFGSWLSSKTSQEEETTGASSQQRRIQQLRWQQCGWRVFGVLRKHDRLGIYERWRSRTLDKR